MGILDEAIREHLELKRQHGADDSELQQLEDDAFGGSGQPGEEQPDPVAEAATEFMTQPDSAAEGDPPAEGSVSPRREPTGGLVDLQEAPDAQPADDAGDEPKAAEDEPDDGPAEEDHPAAEHETVEPVSSGPNTEERHAIADQPTEMFDVAAHIGDEAEPSIEEPAPEDEDLVAEEIAEPRLAPSEPIHLRPAEDDDHEEEDDEFWGEQRLSDELDQALEGPAIDEPAIADEPTSTDEPESAEHEAVAEVEQTKEHEVVFEDESDEHEVVSEVGSTDEHEVVDDRTQVYKKVEDTEVHKNFEEEEKGADGDTDHDALEETPDFLEEAPEDDQLWFEQKPPKDFDFDD